METQINLDLTEEIVNPPVLTEVQKMLGMYENYFLSWMGESRLEKESLPSITNEVFRHLRRITENPEVAESSEKSSADHESSKKDTKNPPNENIGNSIINSETNREDSGDDAEERVVYCYSGNAYPLQRAIAVLTESFFNIQVGDAIFARNQILKCINYVKLLAKKDKSVEDFVAGFEFLIALLEINLKLNENPNELTEEDLQSTFSHFDQLPDQSKAVIFLAKWKFLELSVLGQKRKPEAVLALEKAASLDPTNFTWNFVLSVRLRFFRREMYGTKTVLDEKEINASIASAEHSEVFGGLAYAMCKSGLCQTIAEVISSKILQGNLTWPLTFGKLTFDSTWAAVKYLKKEARNALGRYPNVSFPEFARYSEIFAASLPHQYHNYEMSIAFMTFSLRLKPYNSKANHKMGTLYLLGDGDLDEAISFFRKAVQFSANNFPAWMDLIQSLLQSPLKNEDELHDVFKTIWEKSWKERQIASLKFLHGCYFFMIGEKDNALETWISVYKSTPTPQGEICRDNFRRLFQMKRRYHWSYSSMNLMEVLKAVDERLQQGDDSEDCLKMLKKEITAAFCNPGDRTNAQSQQLYESGDAGKVFRGNSEVDKDFRRGQWDRNPSTGTATSNSGNTVTYYSAGRNPYSESGNSGNNAGRYDRRQRRRSPSPDNWRS